MQKILIIGGVVIIILAAVLFVSGEKSTSEKQSSVEVEPALDSRTTPEGERSALADGTYAVKTEESTVYWAGKKPLIDGYINKGTFGLSSGVIKINGEVRSGALSIDMNKLTVSDTPKKPGKESLLEEHLKGESWFQVATYPEASFTIIEAKSRTDSDVTSVYDIRGNLTLKGQTHELTFPATIYLDSDAKLHAEAEFEFDRTKWGITTASGSFFEGLADKVIDDMVTLSFNLVAEKQ